MSIATILASCEGDRRLTIQELSQYGELLELRNAALAAALHTIGSGMTGRFPGAPDLITAKSPADFRGDMWVWSQRVAKAALAAHDAAAPEPPQS